MSTNNSEVPLTDDEIKENVERIKDRTGTDIDNSMVR